MTANIRRIAVLCIHGIQGSPRQFRWIIDALPKDVHVENLLLPGHGGDVRAFARSGSAQWQACVDEALIRLDSQCDSVLVIGHSMGCLLAIDACRRSVGKIGAMALLACPLSLRPTLRYFKTALRAASKEQTADPFVSAAREANSVHGASPLAYLGCIRPYAQLLLKICAVRRQLAGISVPMLAIHSGRDEIVGIKSLRMLAGANAQTCIAKESGHFRYTESDRDLILRSILGLLKGL